MWMSESWRRVGARLACAVVVAFVVIPGLVAAQAAGNPAVGSLSSGQSVFWQGSYVDDEERVPDPSLCGVSGPCFDYTLDVDSAHAKTLRVALQSADESNDWGVVLISPSGKTVASGTTYTFFGFGEDFDVEVWAPNPAPGAWTVEVVPENVEHGTFEMRAAVDPAIKWPASNPMLRTVAAVRTVKTCAAPIAKGRRRARKPTRCAERRVRTTRTVPRKGVYDVPPDLAADAPWDLTFTQPLSMIGPLEGGNVVAVAGAHNANSTVAGQPTYSCLPDEAIQQHAQRCLRFSSGFSDLGPGRFEVYGSSTAPVAPDGGPLYQVVYRSNGTSYTRRAGTFMFHVPHLHYHVMGIAQFYIYRVLGPNKLVSAGTVLKEGFCLGDVKIFNWYSFAQDEVSPDSPDNCEPTPEPDGTWRVYEGIDPGYEDVYVWQTSGQFVDFANDPDGYYLLRVVVNPDNYILEADPSHANDVAYTYFKVTGDDIYIIQRGRGVSPWDPHKQIENPVYGENP
jgi:lysyl oxidase